MMSGHMPQMPNALPVLGSQLSQVPDYGDAYALERWSFV